MGISRNGETGKNSTDQDIEFLISMKIPASSRRCIFVCFLHYRLKWQGFYPHSRFQRHYLSRLAGLMRSMKVKSRQKKCSPVPP